jgi:hypothetical protein
MKARFMSAKGADIDNQRNQSALLVALLKLGQESFLREHLDALPARLHDWSNAVLRGEGLTEIGPNNCMAQEWSTTDYLPSNIMAPSLEWRGGRWVARVRS